MSQNFLRGDGHEVGFPLLGILVKQYVFALLALSFVLLVLAIPPATRVSLSLPDRAGISDNPWDGSDVLTYVAPARSFLESGEFLRHGKPDLHRTIGYPLFLAGMMKVFGPYWVGATYMLQIFIFSMLFPAVSIISFVMFRAGPLCIRSQFWVLLFLGVGVAYVGQLMTDMLFASLLTIGIALGVVSIIKKSWLFTALHIFVLAWAAQIRPTLSLFWIADLCFLLHTARIWNISFSSRVKKIIWISVALIAVAGNGPAIRNYFNHGMLTPTDILSNNIAYYLAGPVLIDKGRAGEYAEKRSQMIALEDHERIIAQKQFALETVIEYPVSTVKRIVYHFLWNIYEPHWEYIAFVFGEGFYLNSWFDENGKLRWQLILGVPFYILYTMICFFSLFSIFRIINKRYWALLVGLIIYFLPLGASLINGQGARMRVCVEPLLIILACLSVFPLLGHEKHSVVSCEGES